MDDESMQVLQICAQMDREMLLLAVNVARFALLEEEAEDVGRQRRWWVRDWLCRRPIHGQYDALLAELRLEDLKAFKNFLRMEPDTFHLLLQRLEDRIAKQTTNYRSSVPAGLRLAVTLRFLATGDNYHSLMYGFRVAHNTISGIVVSVCQAIIDVLEAEVIKTPTEPQEWLEVAEQFKTRWQFPHALGALDGKHIAIRKPPNSGSSFFNYKGFYSIVLMALVDADYKFRWVQVGDTGSSSDAQIWNHCDLREAIDSGVIGIPDPAPLAADNEPMPYFLIGDDAFAMKTWLMKPYSRRGMDHEETIFNYRLSRARRVVENAFGILANRFRCLLSKMSVNVDNAAIIVRACVCLHNFLRDRNPAADQLVVDQEDDDHNVIPGGWREHVDFADMAQHVGGNRDTRLAKQQRDLLKHYVNAPVGAVPWQDRMVQ